MFVYKYRERPHIRTQDSMSFDSIITLWNGNVMFIIFVPD
jgi:hypothetical protein